MNEFDDFLCEQQSDEFCWWDEFLPEDYDFIEFQENNI